MRQSTGHHLATVISKLDADLRLGYRIANADLRLTDIRSQRGSQARYAPEALTRAATQPEAGKGA
jgi:hypothetical protein